MRAQFQKICIQINMNHDPDCIDQFIHELKSNADLGSIRVIYDQIRELVPEMTGPSFDELTKNMFA